MSFMYNTYYLNTTCYVYQKDYSFFSLLVGEGTILESQQVSNADLTGAKDAKSRVCKNL